MVGSQKVPRWFWGGSQFAPDIHEGYEGYQVIFVGVCHFRLDESNKKVCWIAINDKVVVLNMFFVHPDLWGNDKMIQFDEHIFQLGGSTTNQ